MRRWIGSALVVALVVAPAGLARADHTVQADPDDVRGLLDLEEVRFRHESGPYVWVFRTYASWTTKKIWDDGFFLVQLDTLGSEAADYMALLRSNGKEMQGELFRVRKDGSQRHIRALDASRAGPTGAGIELPPRFLSYGVHRTSFYWWTASLFTGDRCRTTCIDVAPDEGTVEQPIVEQVPSDE